MGDARRDNLAMWESRVPAHAGSPDYALARFRDDATFLSDVVRFDLPRLGDVRGLDGVHLQCHIGTDTVSLARLGARMTGLDFSPAAVEQAGRLARTVGADATFVCADVDDAVAFLGAGRFDLVFTGIGALCWLPDVRRWAHVVSALLRPGGRLFLREGHPVLWALADPSPGEDRLLLEHPYVETPEPTVWHNDDTYVRTNVSLPDSTSHNWNHGLGETVQALLDAGMRLTALEEHDSVPWDALPGLMTDVGGGEWRLTDRPERLPHTYTLQAVKV